MAKKTTKAAVVEDIDPVTFADDDSIATAEPGELAAPGMWATFWGAVKPGIPTIYQSIVTLIIGGLTALGTSWWTGSSKDIETATRVASAEYRVEANKEVSTFAIDAMGKACADGFTKAFKEQMQSKPPAKKG